MAMIVKARGDKNRGKEKYYLYLEVELFTLGYMGWVGLSGFKKSQLTPDNRYPFIIFFDLLSSIISTLSDFDESNYVR